MGKKAKDYRIVWLNNLCDCNDRRGKALEEIEKILKIPRKALTDGEKCDMIERIVDTWRRNEQKD